jgi:NTE family protein
VYGSAHDLRSRRVGRTLDFDISAEERDALYDSGLHAAQQFLESWDYPEYRRVCRGDPAPATEV